MKKLCSEQLESFSKTQLKIIITGKDMASSEDESTKKGESVDETQLKRQTTNEDSKRVEVCRQTVSNCNYITKQPINEYI